MLLNSQLSVLRASAVKPPRVLRYRCELIGAPHDLRLPSPPPSEIATWRTWRVTAIFDDGRARRLRSYTSSTEPNLATLTAIPFRHWVVLPARARTNPLIFPNHL